jgi:hypothetical protein
LDQGLTAPCRDERLRQRQLVMNGAIACTWLGDTDMLELIEQPIAEPEADEVRVRVHTTPIRSSTWTGVYVIDGTKVRWPPTVDANRVILGARSSRLCCCSWWVVC